jgi:TonB family protein
MKPTDRTPMTFAFATAPHLPIVGPMHPLRAQYHPLLYRALGIALFLHLAVFGGILVASVIRPAPPPERAIVVHLDRFPNPAPIDPDHSARRALDPLLQQGTPAFADPVPVPTFWVDPGLTIGGPEDLPYTPTDPTAGGAGGGSIVVDIPPATPSADAPPEVFTAFEEPPSLISLPAPVYPEMARLAGVEGTVMILVLVGKDGKVHEATVVTSLPMLDEAALQAARGAIFRPALQQHKPVAVRVQIPMRFSLR